MDMVNEIKTTPLWLAPVLFITTLILGIYVGTPFAVSYYNLGIPSEVSQLFALMPFVYFYSSIPLCLVCAWGLKFVRKKSNKLVNTGYILLCVILVPVIFYGIGVSNYYG